MVGARCDRSAGGPVPTWGQDLAPDRHVGPVVRSVRVEGPGCGLTLTGRRRWSPAAPVTYEDVAEDRPASSEHGSTAATATSSGTPNRLRG